MPRVQTMIVPVVLLVAMGTVGALDGIYFHVFRFRLFAQPTARFETATHVVRGLLFAGVLSTLLGYVPQGGWYWAFAGLFALELADDVADVLCEPASRRPLGGLPPAEYLIHALVMAITGGIWTSFLVEGWPARLAPTALVPRAAGSLPRLLVWDGRLIAAGAVGLAVTELALLVRSAAARSRTGGALG